MKKRTVIVLVIAFLFTLRALPILAQDEESNATESAVSEETDEIREKVLQKIAEAQSNPKAYLGAVTDITEKTIQLKSTEGEIQQVLINEEETTFVNITKTAKTVKFADVAIGDFIIAMGFLDGNGVLDSKRVLIASEPEEPTRQSLMGTVADVKQGQIVISQKATDEEISIEPQSGISVTEVEEGETTKSRFSNIEEGSIIITVGAFEDEAFEARKIHIISTPEPSPTPVEEHA